MKSLIIAIIVFIVSTIASWILSILNEKYKIVARIFFCLGTIPLLLNIIKFISGFDTMAVIKDSFKAIQEKDDTIEDVDSIEVHVPTHSDSTQDTESTEKHRKETAYATDVAFLNVDDQMYRDENGIVHIEWTPIADQSNYKLKIVIDDPFTSLETNYEYLCDTAQYDFDASGYAEDTTFFVTVSILDTNSSEWIDSDSLSFVLE